MSEPLGLYIHVPFCVSKCAYCDFYSLDDCETKAYSRYVDALLLHMEDYSQSAENYDVDTVFIGGGTPTVLPKSLMIDIIDGINDNFNLNRDAEFTLECNPATVDIATLRRYRKAGVNRLSMGLQSAVDTELAALSRIHTYEDFVNSYNAARQAKFDNINIDIMYGIPEQTPESLRYTLETVCALEPEHISLYDLKIEPNTPFGKSQDKLNLPDEDDEYAMYEDSIAYLESMGYHQYEISNFAREGYECRHNLKYWNCDPYLGLGPAAHSYYNGVRFSFVSDVYKYMEAIETLESRIDITNERYKISPGERLGEYVMLRLRLNEGVDTEKFYSLFGIDFEQLYAKYLPLYVDNGFMTHEGNCYAFTTRGMFVSNYILSAMLDFDSEIVSNIVNGTDK